MKIAVLIPTYNNGAVIRYALESALNQTFEPSEIIIVADGAPPETLALLDDYSGRDRRIRPMKFEKGERHGEAWRDLALRQSAADAVCYLCDDDLWFPNHLAVFRNLLEDADFAHTRNLTISPNLTIVGQAEDLADHATRQKMLVHRHNFFGLSVAGHRLDAYRRLPVGWAAAPAAMWTDLHMWRKWLAAAGMRLKTSGANTALNFAHATRDPAVLLSEVGFWSEMLAIPYMQEALDELLPADNQPLALASVVRRARQLEAKAGKRPSLFRRWFTPQR